MKKILMLFFGIILITLTSFYFSKTENNGHSGKCTGSEYCTACSSCSRCGHCGAGGTCGVCSGSKSKNNKTSDYSKNKISASRQAKKGNQSQNFSNISKDDFDMVTSDRSTNIFEKPSFQSKVIENISKNTKLIQLLKLDSWYKVKIKDSEKIGYIYYKDVK